MITAHKPRQQMEVLSNVLSNVCAGVVGDDLANVPVTRFHYRTSLSGLVEGRNDVAGLHDNSNIVQGAIGGVQRRQPRKMSEHFSKTVPKRLCWFPAGLSEFGGIDLKGVVGTEILLR